MLEKFVIIFRKTTFVDHFLIATCLGKKRHNIVSIEKFVFLLLLFKKSDVKIV